MKKSIAFLTTLSLLFLSNHCLLAFTFSTDVHDECLTHEHHHEGDESPSHHDNCPNSDHSGPCCMTLTQDVPGLIPASPIPIKLVVLDTLHFVLLPTHELPGANAKGTLYATGPPGPHPEEVHLSLLSPRAPPSTSSL